MSSNFDGSYLDHAVQQPSTAFKKAEENLYFLSEGFGEYCGLTSPNSLGLRTSNSTLSSRYGNNGRGAHTSTREALDRNDHIRANATGIPSNRNRHEPPREPHESRDVTAHIRAVERSYDERLMDGRGSSRDAQRASRESARSHSDSTNSTLGAAYRPRPRNLPRQQRHGTYDGHGKVVIEQPKPRAVFQSLPTPRTEDRSNTEYPDGTRTNITESNTNRNKRNHGINRPPDIRIESLATEPERRKPPLSPRIRQIQREELGRDHHTGRPTKNPLLGESPRHHSLEVPEKKTNIKRTMSAPELRRTSADNLRLNNIKCTSNCEKLSVIHGSRSQTRTNSKTKGSRSKSLPVVALPRISSKRIHNTDADPLRYFAYLGKRFQFRDRLPSTHNVLSARPVILTSTSVISPQVSNNFRDHLDGYEPFATSKYQNACQDLIDCCTCMCCVKALFYHCTKDDEPEGELSEHPCSCSTPVNNCLGRWGIMGMLSVCMPCLLCYLPIQGCKRIVDYCRRTQSNDG